MKYSYGKQTFASQKATKLYFQTMLTRWTQSPTLPICGDAHFELHDLFDNHSQVQSKRGCGIAHFYVDRSPSKFGDSCFYLQRTDGSYTDFSYRECVQNSTPKVRVMRAMRKSVDTDIYVKKLEYFNEHANDGKIRCPLTQAEMDWDACEADHEQPNTFEVICTAFIFAHALNWDTFPLLDCDNQITDLSGTWKTKFIEYHHKIAKIRLISSTQNRKQAAGFTMKKKGFGYISI